MLQNLFSFPQLRLRKWSFFIHSTTRTAPYVHPRLDSILELCRAFLILNLRLWNPTCFQVIAKNPDGSQAANEEIYITATNYQYEYEWSGTFYTDGNGVIKYAINDIDKKIPNLNVKVSMK